MSVATDTAIQPSIIDPVTASVIQGALQNIAIEMGYKLMRMSYSSIIRESEDFGAALVDERGRQLAESLQSTPLQSGPIPGYVQNVIETVRRRRVQVLRHGMGRATRAPGDELAAWDTAWFRMAPMDLRVPP
jgi:N-methylhydantoinase B